MGKLTGMRHGDEVNALMAFYQEQAGSLEAAGLYFMAAVALGAALETALLAFMLVEWEDLEVPDDVQLRHLIDAAKKFDLLNAAKFQGAVSVETVIHEIQGMRNNVHPARALRTSFKPDAFGATEYRRLREIYITVTDNLVRNL